jgi:uncharacterized protein YraI
VSRFVSVCLCAIVVLAALTGSLFLRPASVLAASGTLSIATPLHESPGHGAPLIALLAEGTVVSIDGPPVDGFYPVTAGTVSGWMRGETLVLEKDVSVEGAETEPPVAEPDGMAPVEQTADGDPALTAETPVEGTGTDTEWTEPAGDATYDDQNAKAVDPATGAAATDGSPPMAEPAPVEEAAPVAEPVPADDLAPMNEPAPVDELASKDAAAPPPALDSGAAPVPVNAGGAPPPPESVPDASASEVAAAPTPDPNVTPIPAAVVSPVGPASVKVDAPIRAGPGPSYDLIFTVPMGSTLQQTGNVIDGYVTAQYKEVTGWVALEHLGPASSFVAETPPAASAAPAETPPVETPPAETPPAEIPPAETAPVAAAPVEVKTPRPGSGVAYTTVDMSLRNGPSATEAPVTVVPAGSRVVLTGVMEGGFQRVTYKDQIGWIADEYLQSPADPEPEVGRHGNPQYSRREIIRIINQAADRYGQSRSDMVRVAECESNLDPYAVNPSGSYGLFQFIRSTWKSTPYGNKDIFDPEANANAAAWMWSEGVCQ